MTTKRRGTEDDIRIFCVALCPLWLNPAVRVAIDIRRIAEFGVGTYIRNIVRALGRLDSESKYFLIGTPEKVAEIGSLPANFQAVPLLGNDTTIKSYFDFRSHPQALELRPGAHSAPVLAAANICRVLT